MSTETKQKKSGNWQDGFVRFFDFWTPNSLVFVFLLTILVAILALIFCGSPIMTSTETQKSLMDAWTGGFWNLLTFGMQMSLVMLTGYVLASSPPVKKALKKVASIPNSQAAAFFTLMLVGGILNWIHWGIGMMASIMIAREVLAASKVKGYKIHQTALVGAVYCTAACAAGISQAAPLYAATPNYLKGLVSTEIAGLLDASYPMSVSVLSPLVITQCVILFVIIAVVGYVVLPKRSDRIVEISEQFKDEILGSNVIEEKPVRNTFASWINNSPILNLIIGIFGLIWCIRLLAKSGIVGISLNNYNFLLLMLGVLLCGTPEKFCEIVQKSIGAIWGVVIQFPFYAGIFGIIAYTGLSDVIVKVFLNISNTQNFPLVTFVYSSILNMIVPSGGSKFVIEAPYILESAVRLGSSVPKVICAYTFGDMTTNLIQPFWALPFLSMCKVKFKDILPFTLCICAGCYLFNVLYFIFAY